MGDISNLVVRSMDRSVLSASSTDFVVSVSPGLKRVKQAKLMAANIPNTFYNVTSANNFGTFYITTPGNSFNFTIPNGNYSSAQLLTTVAAAMSTVSGQTITIVQNPNNYFLTFAIGTGVFALSAVLSAVLGIWGLLAVPLSSFSVTGFYPSSPAASFTSAFGYFLNPPTSLYLSVTELGVNTQLSNGFQSTFCITNNVNAGSVDFFADMSNYHSTTKNVTNQNIQALTCRLTDYLGNIISLNGANWEFVLEIDYHPPK